MMRRMIAAALLLLAPLAGAADLEVHAAISLTEALTEIGERFRRETGTVVRFNFGGSSMLARQIAEGSGGDVFVSADEEKMNALMRAGLIRRSSRRTVLTNTLVVVVPRRAGGALVTAADLAKMTRIAIAEPRSVPAGIYARQYLEHAGLWQILQPKMIPTENVRAALAAVESENADAAIVYRTDAGMASNVRIALTLDGSWAPKITYPAAVLSESPHPAAATRFVNYLTGSQARQIFRRFGFGVS
jgi:molybdate transport system substrate-binding protein